MSSFVDELPTIESPFTRVFHVATELPNAGAIMLGLMALGFLVLSVSYQRLSERTSS